MKDLFIALAGLFFVISFFYGRFQMMLDKYVLAQFFGIAIIAWSMFEAWSGQHHGKFGKIHVMESPIFYMLLTGL